MLFKSSVRSIVTLSNENVFYTIGPYVVWLDERFTQIYKEKVVSNANIISGIACNSTENQLVLWGRREICILCVDFSNSLFYVRYSSVDLDNSWILNCSFLDDDRILVGFAENGSFGVFDLGASDIRKMKRFSYHLEGNISCFDYCSRSETISYGDISGNVAVNDSFANLRWKKRIFAQLCWLKIDSAGRKVIGCCSNGKIHIFSLDSGEDLQVLNGHINRALGIHLMGRLGSFVTFGEDLILKLWQYDNERMIKSWKFDDCGGILCLSSNEKEQ